MKHVWHLKSHLSMQVYGNFGLYGSPLLEFHELDQLEKIQQHESGKLKGLCQVWLI